MKTNILIVGAGRMAEAIISGLVKKEEQLGKLTVANRTDKGRLNHLKHTYNIAITEDWTKEVEDNSCIILATPPKSQEEQLKILSGIVNGQLIITVAAGIDPTYMEKRLPNGTSVCWIMPNTGAQIGKSMSTFVCGKHVNHTERNLIHFILSAIGEAEELTEQQVHDMTAITGSAPAFVYTFVQALEKAAMKSGVTREQARKLVTKMVSGSIAMLESGSEPEQLISQVASPGGSTAEGLKVLEEANFQQIIEGAVEATNKHARNQGK
ncbi:pyrroline-5-carboxylate reductase [Evansella cellulosilytica]|uniref:Pyrroline-5-carboxylate reductase n=1 Tax=Evansella cellulosilytica (strain ATCC 21833 / DSM 2522 / FERM P-1141 / JCM 9156 / N-4) TaxID=649639 RepID=E6U1Q6_EVAC2|nr:pyrroline-5-carboxylate reductase [Evansella cellulosilytica]ADU31553.1 pyrroline-5-carboxylate reductase [Evansella cellulosilytica DSM 2522]